MRNTQFVPSHHLEEAVRRKVIDAEQMHEILAISRAMGQGGPTADLGWLSIAQAVLAAAIVGIPALAAFGGLSASRQIGALLAVSAGVMGFLLVATVALRRVGAGPALSGITAAGAALWSWGVGAAIHAIVRLPPHGVDRYGEQWRLADRIQSQGYVVGFATVLVASLVVGFALRAPTAAATGAFGFVMMSVLGLEDAARGSGYRWAGVVMFVMALAGVLFVAAAALDAKMKSTRFDPAFWLYTAGLFPLALGAGTAVDRDASMTLPMAVLAACTLAAGVWADRKSVILGGAFALFGVIPFGASEARMGGSMVAAAFALSTAMVLVAVAGTRRVYLARARAGIVAPERSVWG